MSDGKSKILDEIFPDKLVSRLERYVGVSIIAASPVSFGLINNTNIEAVMKTQEFMSIPVSVGILIANGLITELRKRRNTHLVEQIPGMVQY